MGTANWPGSSEESNLSGPSVSGVNLEKALENYFSTAFHFPVEPSSGNQHQDLFFSDLPDLPEGADDGLIDEEMFFDAVAEQARRESAASFGGAESCGEGFGEGFEGYDPALQDNRLPYNPLAGEPRAGEPLADNPLAANPLPAGMARKYLDVLRFAEPLIMPPPLRVAVYGGSKRVQRLLPTLTAEEQAHYVQWTPELGAAALAGLDPAKLSDEELLTYIQATERQASWSMARQSAAINEFSTRRPPVCGEEPPEKHPDRSRYAAAELMAMFAISTGAAERLITDAELLTRHLPDTFAEFDQGSLDIRRVRSVIRGCQNTPPEILHELESKFLNQAMNSNPNALTRKVRGLAERHNPEPISERHRRARTGRDVWLTPLPDGMALLGARLPATDATLLFNSLDEWARSAKLNGEDSHGITPTGRPSRSLSEYRADVLIDLLHQVLLHSSTPPPNTSGVNSSGANSSGANSSGEEANGAGWSGAGPYFRNRIPAILNITVSADRLMGKSADPVILDGFGPIPVDDVNHLAATAKFWRRFLTDPDTGIMVSIGRKSRKPPKAMAREVRFRDPVCTGIGCDRPARSCELDHTNPFNRITYSSDGSELPPGETSIENLRPRCPYCHHLKDDPHTGWTVEHVSPGVTKTTTPTGRVYIQTQAGVEAPF
ncbi:hypothetical protein ABIB48_003422 [Arthrobacter sp. UYCu511]|uniref:HNH endonuclease signature motif containing protein n=1 Tax=Arthrobacter sp. UYCu511 TaxID=3156337 RepID=UPI0033923D49